MTRSRGAGPAVRRAGARSTPSAAHRSAAGAGRRSARRGTRGYLFLLPAVAVYVLLVLVPWVHTAWLSFFDWDGVTAGRWIGLGNYRDVVREPLLRGAVVHSAVLIVFYSFIPVAIGMVVAALLRGKTGRGWGVARTVIFLPQIVPLVATGLAWRWMYADNGTINQLLRAVGLGGLARTWLGDYASALPAVGIVGSWVETGLCVVFFLAGIQKIDKALFEAARMDGAGAVREFFAITVPLMRGEIAVALTLTMIAALSAFDVVFATTGGGPGNQTTVPGLLVYRLAFSYGQVGRACAMGVVLSALIFVVVLVINRLVREEE